MRRTLAREGWRLVVLIFGSLWALSALPSVIGGMVWASTQASSVTHDILVVAGTLLLAGWALVPVLVPGLDDSLDITRFATFGVSTRALVPALLVASLVGVPTLFTALVCLAPAIAWFGAGGPAAAALAVLLAPVALITCVLASRISTGLAARVLGSRRSRESGAVVGVLVLVLTVPLVITIGSLGLEGALEHVPGVARVLGWTPLGLVWAAPAAMADGDLVGAGTRTLLALAWVGVGLVVWERLLHRALVRPPSRGGEVRRRVDAMLPRREGRGPGARAAAAVARRGLRSWSTDPRYLSSLLGAVVAPVMIVLLAATVVDAPAAVALSMGPLMAGTIGWGRHNDVAFDGTAFWMHVASRVPGWSDRLGRTVATLVWAVPMTAAVGTTGALVGGRPDLVLAAVGASVGVLCGGLAVSATFSALLPYPVPEAGANPYAAQMGAVGATMVAQAVTSAASLLVCAPVLVAYGAALWWSASLAPVVLLMGVVGGGAVLWVGVVLGGRTYDARQVRLLARMR